MASIVCLSDKLNSGQYLGCNDFLFICESGSKVIGAGVGGKSVRQADVSGGTHFPRKLCPTGQDILSVLG